MGWEAKRREGKEWKEKGKEEKRRGGTERNGKGRGGGCGRHTRWSRYSPGAAPTSFRHPSPNFLTKVTFDGTAHGAPLAVPRFPREELRESGKMLIVMAVMRISSLIEAYS